ncbi:MAG TPA: lysine-sensitive aspartokinase 3 [Thermoanaerobaculia bacterium]|nr:lysine-sensitive aspartokinase 3 [Thermoanaerobaculia bacterium]
MTDVLKFGGTSVGTAERIRDVACLVARRGGDPCVVVVSAMGGVTDELVGLKISSNGKERAAADAGLERLAQRHRHALDALQLPSGEKGATAAAVEEELDRARILSTGISLLEEISPRTSDALLSVGEMISSRLVAPALRAAGIPAVWVDPRDVLVTDAAHGAALPDEAATAANVAARVLPELDAGRVVVTGGFVGATREGVTTTLGRGGSDYSAALLGAALKDAGRAVGAIEIWTDVDGILTADPRIVPAARPVPEVSAAEAAELAFFGAKVLHPATIRPAVARGIPVRVRNSFRPDAPGTTVRAEAAGVGVRALAMRRGVAAVFVGNPRMLLAHGYAARVFSVFETHRVPVDVIATSEVSISITVDAKAPLDAVVKDLSSFAEVSVLPGLAVVSVAGKALRTTAGIAHRVFEAMGDVNVVLISQGASDTNMTFVVAEKDAPEALRRLHREFFEGTKT